MQTTDPVQSKPDPLTLVANHLRRIKGEFECVEYLRREGRFEEARAWHERNHGPIQFALPLRPYGQGIQHELRAAFGDDAERLEVQLALLATDLLDWHANSSVADAWSEAQLAEIARIHGVLSELANKFGAAWEAREAKRHGPLVAADYGYVIAHGRRHAFAIGAQTRIIEALHAEWLKAGDGATLGVHRLQEVSESSADRFKMHKVFEKHTALGEILHSPAKGKWALYLRAPAPSKTKNGPSTGPMSGPADREDGEHEKRSPAKVSRRAAGAVAPSPRARKLAPRRS